ncbi:MAG: hypothetical protein KGJ77_02380 [Acidobacteriota bacterium]|nr:hypothetical protein [Acidobacteriota bacterium]
MGGKHAVDHRTVARRGDLAWTGSLACTCGWAVHAGPFGARYVVADVLATEWAAHEGSGQGTVRASAKAS